ncbi:MATE family efflux transporter [Spirochaeta thermophila]|nr:MATE family efflux transporter [Spirochaeta thermophila]
MQQVRNSRFQDQMFSGPVLPLLVRLSLPIFAGMFFQLLYNITDTVWISWIDLEDPSLVGGIGIIFPLLFFFMALGNGLMVGTASLVARAVGEENEEKLDAAADSGIFMAVLISVAMLAGGYLLKEQLVGALGAEGDYYMRALEYFTYILPGAAFIFMQNTLIGVLQGEGLVNYVMRSMIIGTVLNIVLDPVFIFLFGWGIKGAALATVLAQGIGFLYVVYVFLAGKTRVPIHIRLSGIRGKVMAEIFSVGFPQTLGQAIMSLSFLIFNRIVIAIDPLALTAFTLCGRFDQAILMPIFAVASALVTMMGQNFGRRLYDRMLSIWHVALRVSVATVTVIVLAIVVFAPRIFSLFTDVPEVLSYAVAQVRTMEYAFIFASFGILGRSFFQAIGKGWAGLLLVLLRLVLLAVPAVLFFVYVLHLGIRGVWFGLIFANLSTALTAALWVPRTIRSMMEREPMPALR